MLVIHGGALSIMSADASQAYDYNLYGDVEPYREYDTMIYFVLSLRRGEPKVVCFDWECRFKSWLRLNA